MLLTQLEYFVALARESHFGRAAAACFVSPSTLSEAVRKLEVELGVPLVRRSHSYEGLTAEGKLALVWARRVVADRDALTEELSAARGHLAGTAQLGTIPSGIAAAAHVVSALAQAHPQVHSTVQTGLSSENVVARLRSFELDAGIIHPSAADGPDLVAAALGEAASVVVSSPGVFDETLDAVTGPMLASVQLGLLMQGMRARRVADEAWRKAGLDLRPAAEADSVEALLGLVGHGTWAVVVPASSVAARLADPSIHVLPLVEPTISTPLAMVRLAAKPLPALMRALDAAAAAAAAHPQSFSMQS